MEAIVLAGGFGTRLASIVSNVPKPMAPLNGKPFLEYILSELAENGITHIVLAVHHKKEFIMDYFGNSFRGVQIDYSVEVSPLKTGGAIKQALRYCQENYVFVINGDTFYEVPLKDMRCKSLQTNKTVTIAVKEMHNFSRYGKVDVDKEGLITTFHEKEFCACGYINGGIYDIARNALDQSPDIFSIEEEFFPKIVKAGEIGAFISNGYFIDIGVPEDYEKAQNELRY